MRVIIIVILFTCVVHGRWFIYSSPKPMAPYNSSISSVVSYQKCDQSMYAACIFENPIAEGGWYTFNYNVTVISTDCKCSDMSETECDNTVNQIYTAAKSDIDIDMHCYHSDYCNWNYLEGIHLSKIYVKVSMYENKTCNVTVYWNYYDYAPYSDQPSIFSGSILLIPLAIGSVVIALGYAIRWLVLYKTRRGYVSI